MNNTLCIYKYNLVCCLMISLLVNMFIGTTNGDVERYITLIHTHSLTDQSKINQI